MEEDIRKQGALYLQQHQRFVKRWKRVWCMLFGESSRSVSRLEFFDWKDTLERSDKNFRKQQEHKKVIRLVDCIQVVQVEQDCPRGTSSFLLETTQRMFVFSVETTQVKEWTRKLCETAFPGPQGSGLEPKGPFMRGALGPRRSDATASTASCLVCVQMSWAESAGPQRGRRDEEEEGTENNLLYSCRETVCDFTVCVRRTEASQRCGLRGVCVLRPDTEALQLLDAQTLQPLLLWPYRYLRRFGRDKASFSFEAGRRCDSGEGCFEFDTQQGALLFQTLESSIRLHRGASGAESPRPVAHSLRLAAPQDEDCVYSTVNEVKDTAETHTLQLPPVEKLLCGVKSLDLDSNRKQLRGRLSCPLPPAGPEPPCPQTCRAAAPPQEAEYSLPFDLVSAQPEAASARGPGPDPLYDSIDESRIGPAFWGAAVAEHIYDEPEGRGGQAPRPPASAYAQPEEVMGDAWKIMGTAADPKGHQFPYDPRADDYAVPRATLRAANHSAALDESLYDNMMERGEGGGR